MTAFIAIGFHRKEPRRWPAKRSPMTPTKTRPARSPFSGRMRLLPMVAPMLSAAPPALPRMQKSMAKEASWAPVVHMKLPVAMPPFCSVFRCRRATLRPSGPASTRECIWEVALLHRVTGRRGDFSEEGEDAWQTPAEPPDAPLPVPAPSAPEDEPPGPVLAGTWTAWLGALATGPAAWAGVIDPKSRAATTAAAAPARAIRVLFIG